MSLANLPRFRAGGVCLPAILPNGQIIGANVTKENFFFII